MEIFQVFVDMFSKSIAPDLFMWKRVKKASSKRKYLYSVSVIGITECCIAVILHVQLLLLYVSPYDTSRVSKRKRTLKALVKHTFLFE